MENRAHAIVAVCFLVVLTVGAVLTFHWLSSGPGTPRVYQIVTRQSVAGLAPQSRVMFKGLQVGHVQSVRFDPQDHSRVIIKFRVQPDAYITHATYAVLAMKGLLGGKILMLKLGEGSRAPLETSAGQPAQIPLQQGMIGQLKQTAGESLQQLHALLASANDLLDASNRKHISSILGQLDTLTARLIALEDQLMPAVKQLPQLLAEVHKAVGAAQNLLVQANELVEQARVPVKGAAELEDSIQQLSHKLNQRTLPSIQELVDSLTRTSRSLQELAQELKARPQSVIFGSPSPRPGPGEPGFTRGNKGERERE